MKTSHLAVALAVVVGALGVVAYNESRKRKAAEAAAIAGYGQATGLVNVPFIGWAFTGGGQV